MRGVFAERRSGMGRLKHLPKYHMPLWLTLLARLPSLLTSTFTGGMLGSEHYEFAIALYTLTGLLTLICVLWYRKESKQQKKEEARQSAPEE